MKVIIIEDLSIKEYEIRRLKKVIISKRNDFLELIVYSMNPERYKKHNKKPNITRTVLHLKPMIRFRNLINKYLEVI